MLEAAAPFTRMVEEATLLRNLRMGALLDTIGSTVLGPKAPGALLQALTDLYVDFLVAIIQRSLTGESMKLGSGVATNICKLR